MSNSLKSTCFLLQTLCLTQGFVPGRGRPQLEVIKLGPGKNPEVVAITKEETNQLEGMGSRVLDVGAVCRGGKDLANGHTGGTHLQGKPDHMEPRFPKRTGWVGQALLLRCCLPRRWTCVLLRLS